MTKKKEPDLGLYLSVVKAHGEDAAYAELVAVGKEVSVTFLLSELELSKLQAMLNSTALALSKKNRELFQKAAAKAKKKRTS